MKIDIIKNSIIDLTHRVEMLGSMFDVPVVDKLSVELHGEIDLESRPWNVGLIVGPSGSGKSTILNNTFGIPEELRWHSRSVINDFPDILSMESIASVCSSVGFNTIPAWLRPFSVLSNGEKFRVEIARRLLSDRSPVLIDEFTSVVDRQVAQITANAVGKFIRSSNKQLVASTCHYDIIEWLNPDWILEPGNPIKFHWRLLQPKPPITISISRVKYETWELFKNFHYMSQDLNKAARCYGLFIETSNTTGLGVRSDDANIRPHSDRNQHDCGDGGQDRIPYVLHENLSGNPRLDTIQSSELAQDATGNATTSKDVLPPEPRIQRNDSEKTTSRLASMCGILFRPHPKVKDIMGVSRIVTLPDFQGLGLAFVLADTIGSAYKAVGKRLHNYPNHPAYVRSYQRSPKWMQVKSSGDHSPRAGVSSTVGGFGGKRCAVFMYIGPSMNLEDAKRLIGGSDEL